jgi:hypothetical protein
MLNGYSDVRASKRDGDEVEFRTTRKIDRIFEARVKQIYGAELGVFELRAGRPS